MSLLYFQHLPENVFLITDTLSTDSDGSPLIYVNKAFVYPTLNMVCAVTGILQLALRWNERLLERISVLDIDNLDLFTTDTLKEIWEELKKELPINENTSTIHHFGWSERDKQYVRYVYRSENNFRSERFTEAGVGVKPHPENIDDVSALDPLDLVKKIKIEQDKKERDRIYIGGEFIVTALTEDRSILIKKIHRYDDFYDLWEKMNEKY